MIRLKTSTSVMPRSSCTLNGSAFIALWNHALLCQNGTLLLLQILFPE